MFIQKRNHTSVNYVERPSALHQHFVYTRESIQEKNHKTEVCDKAFHYPTILSNKKICTREKPYKYEDCGKALNYPSILSKHKNNSYRRESLQMWSMWPGLLVHTFWKEENLYRWETLNLWCINQVLQNFPDSFSSFDNSFWRETIQKWGMWKSLLYKVIYVSTQINSQCREYLQIKRTWQSGQQI